MSCSLEELSVAEKIELVKQIADKKQGRSDSDWSEICDFFDLDINADTLRKAGVGIKLAEDAGMLSGKTKANDVSNGYVERQKMRDLQRQVNAMYRSESRSELLREEIKSAVSSLKPIEITPYYRPDVANGRRNLVVALGDFHYGADIHVDGLLGDTINEYNAAVFEERMERLLEEIVAILHKEHVSSAHIFLVGDLIDGMLRQSQLMKLQYGMVESTIKLSEYLAAWIGKLGLYADVYVHAATGNHSEVRPLRSKAREFEDENLEKIIMWYLSARFEGIDNIYIDDQCKKHVFAEIEGFSFLLLHGDGEKNIDVIAKEAINMYARPIDFFICGHTHKEQEYPAGMTNDGNSVIIRTPSICGTDRYAQSKGYGGKPGAIAMIIERDYGRRCVYPIQL